MLTTLPGWVASDDESIRREAAPYVAMTPEERGAHLVAVCRAAARMLASRADREHILASEDPLPESTVRALAMLRARARRRA